jgi:small GTP-binding protein
VLLLVGRTGVGKSSTINSLIDKEIAKVGGYEATTMEVQGYDLKINDVNFTVFDTPGLCDDFEEEGNDEKYLQLMQSQVKEIDSMWFVSRLDETRVTADEKRGIKLI